MNRAAEAISHHNRLYALLLAIAALAAYANSMDGQWFLDDYGCIKHNPSLGAFWPAAEEIPHGLQRRHLGRLTLWLNYHLGGFNPFGYHLVNLSIHLAAGLVLFALVRRTLALPGIDDVLASKANPVAFAVALLWLVHPLQTESVTYLVQRLESLVSLFYLLTIYSLLRSSTVQSTSKQAFAWYTAAIISFWLGVATKEIIVTAPLVVLLYDRIFLATSFRELLRRRWPIYVAFLPVIPWVVWVLTNGPTPDGRVLEGFAMNGVTPVQYLLTQMGVVLHYLRLTFWPVGQCLDYRWPLVADPVDALPEISGIVALVTSCLVGLKYRPRLAFLGITFFIILAPTSSIMPILDPAVEHRMYLPLAAVLVLVVVPIARYSRGIVPPVALTGTALLLAMLTVERNRLYCDPISMWKDVIARAPHNERAYCNLGCSLGRDYQFEAAAQALKYAAELAPESRDIQARLDQTRELKVLFERIEHGEVLDESM